MPADFYRDHPQRRTVIRELHPGDQAVLNDEFQAVYTDLVDNWSDKYRRWAR